MKIYLDDLRSPPPEWTLTRWPIEVMNLIEGNQGKIEEISLDHDLGDDVCGTGYDVLKWIEEQVFNDPSFIPPQKITIHTANPVAKKRMEEVVSQIDKRIKGNMTISS